MGIYVGPFTTTFLAGELPSATKFTEVANALTALTGPWTDFSSSLVITGSSVNPTKGAGTTYVASYNQVGKLVIFTFNVTIGSGWASGTGTYSFNLPVTAKAANVVYGTARLLDSGVAYYTAFCYAVTTTGLGIIKHGDNTLLGSGGPGSAWATGDSIGVTFWYEAA